MVKLKTILNLDITPHTRIYFKKDDIWHTIDIDYTAHINGGVDTSNLRCIRMDCKAWLSEEFKERKVDHTIACNSTFEIWLK